MNISDASLDQEVAIIGFGYVGLTLGVALANSGLKVTGLEINSEIVESTNKGIPHFKERGLDVVLRRVVDDGMLLATENSKDLSKSTVFFITVGTPLNSEGEINLESIKNASHQVAKIMPDDSLVIYRSTMQVGTARDIVKPILESYGKSFRLAVCPERTLEGKALEELRFLPQIIGGFDDIAKERATKIFDNITEKTISVSSPETAEVIKLVDNTYRDVQFAFGNEVASFCNDIDGVNAGEVVRLGKMGYERTNVASPGLVGGPCLSKDPHILFKSASSHGISMNLTKAARDINESMPKIAAEFIANKLNSLSTPKITIAGFAFKGTPETDDLRGSMSIDVMNALEIQIPKCSFRIFDPIVELKVLQNFSKKVYSNFDESISDSDAIIICNNHEFFSSNDLRAMLSTNDRIKLVYDFWNNFDYLDLYQKKELNYVTFGSHWIFDEENNI
tara:strand:+ start:464 stop:1813 length:1350 start_codon:yes stop_codon:yes gene_type:complete